MRIPFFVLSALLPVVCAAASSYLCKSNEQVIFGCMAGKKMISVCASPLFTPTTGYLQYRFGTPSKLELEYPEKPEPPKGHFWFSSTGYAGGGEARIRFVNQGSQYTVFARTVRTGFGSDGKHYPAFSAGVGIKARGQKDTTRLCTSDDGTIDATAYDHPEMMEQFNSDYAP
jgi:hypothetical protein